MTTVLFLLCNLLLCNSRTFVAGFTITKQAVPSSYHTSSRIQKTHLWYIEGDDKNEKDEDADEAFLTSGNDSNKGKKRKKKKLDVTVDVDVKVTRGEQETNYVAKQEVEEEFYQEDITDSPVAEIPVQDEGSSSDELVSSLDLVEDFDDDEVNAADFITELEVEVEEVEVEAEEEEVISNNVTDNIVSVAEGNVEVESEPPLIKAIEPTKHKPRKKFISPIQLLKKVPRVEPINITSIFFVKPMPLPSVTNNDNKSGKNSKNITWKDRMLSQERRPTAFQATNYLESLGSSNSDTKNEAQDNSNDELYKNLKAQQDNLRNEQQKSMKEAIYEAMRRTNPKDVIDKRIEEGEKKRKKMEREKLEMEYVERKERLDARKWEAEEALALEEGGESTSGTDVPKNTVRKSRRGLPILGPFIKSPSPLLVGSTITFQYSDMTPFQKKAVEVSQVYHEEHCARMKEAADEAGEEGGIQAAPIVAIIDNFTGEYTELSPGDDQKKQKRFATLSAIEIETSSDGSSEVVKLTGVGRVFLYDYFSSKDAGITEEEEELENILKLIQQYDREQEGIEDDDQIEDDDEDDFPVVMASFDVILDDSSILVNKSTKHQDATVHRASSLHAITELYRTANKVYRLHEDRKKLVAGLKTAEERLLLGQERMNENCDIEYEDCDGIGILSEGVDFLPIATDAVEITTGSVRLSPLSKMKNYGFGSYGILSTIPDLTRQLMDYLEPYYSPSHREREEYEAEIASFIAFKCLEEYVDPSDVAAAMLSPSATERLNMAYDLMMRHREELTELVKMISDDLHECGDDCKW